jgi:hypothetical protein
MGWVKIPDFQPLTCLAVLENMPPSLLTLSLAREEDYRRKTDAMERSAEGGGSHSNGSGIELVRLKPEHKQSTKLNQGEPIQPKQ